ncbi:MAG: hypothetical protein AAF573_02520 [Bacteroidota bacterium]
MEHNILDEKINEEGQFFDHTAQEKLLTISRWAKLLSAMLYVNVVYLVYQFIQMTILTYNLKKNNILFSEMVMVAIYLFLIIFTFLAAYNLMGFSNRLLTSFKLKNNKIFTFSIENLRSYFKFFGFFMILISLVILTYIYALFLRY